MDDLAVREGPEPAWVRIDVGETRLQHLKRLALEHRITHNELVLRIIDERLHGEGMVPSAAVPFAARAGH